MKQVYPTFILNVNDNSEYPFLVCVPDMEIFTEGSNFADAIEMARDAIGATGISLEDDGTKLPVPSGQNEAIEKVKQYSDDDVDFSNGILTYVDIDFSEYRKKIDNKTIRRNVALPSWLNYEAEHSGINVSRTLQEALITTLTKEMFSKDNVTILNWIYENRDGLKKISEQFIPRSINGVDLYDLYESDNSVFVMLENVEGYKYKRFNLITHIRLSEDQTRMRLDFNYEGVDFFVKYHDEIIDYIIKKQNRIAKKSNS